MHVCMNEIWGCAPPSFLYFKNEGCRTGGWLYDMTWDYSHGSPLYKSQVSNVVASGCGCCMHSETLSTALQSTSLSHVCTTEESGLVSEIQGTQYCVGTLLVTMVTLTYVGWELSNHSETLNGFWLSGPVQHCNHEEWMAMGLYAIRTSLHYSCGHMGWLM